MASFRTYLMLLFSMGVFSVQWDSATGDEPADAAKAEQDKLQGLWQTSPGGIEHRGGKQVVRNPVLEGPCFFIHGDRLLWLDGDGKPTGQTMKITLNLNADPKQITFAPEVETEDHKSEKGIYLLTDSSWRIHVGLDGGPSPKSFLELNNPVKGNDGSEWLVRRKKLSGE